MERGLVSFAMALGMWACSAAPPQVPPVTPNSGECRVTAEEGSEGPPASAPDGRFLPAPAPATSSQAGLEVTLPSRPPQAGLPLRLPALLAQPKSPSTAQWRALPNGSDAAMTAIVSNASEPTPVRVRAVAGLAARASSIGLGTLKELIMSARVANPIGQAAIAGFDAFYVTAPAVVERTLGGVLRTGDAALRIEAVRTLGRLIGQGGVRALLEGHQSTEKAPAVRTALDAALKGATAQ